MSEEYQRIIDEMARQLAMTLEREFKEHGHLVMYVSFIVGKYLVRSARKAIRDFNDGKHHIIKINNAKDLEEAKAKLRTMLYKHIFAYHGDGELLTSTVQVVDKNMFQVLQRLAKKMDVHLAYAKHGNKYAVMVATDDIDKVKKLNDLITKHATLNKVDTEHGDEMIKRIADSLKDILTSMFLMDFYKSFFAQNRPVGIKYRQSINKWHQNAVRHLTFLLKNDLNGSDIQKFYTDLLSNREHIQKEIIDKTKEIINSLPDKERYERIVKDDNKVMHDILLPIITNEYFTRPQEENKKEKISAKITEATGLNESIIGKIRNVIQDSIDNAVGNITESYTALNNGKALYIASTNEFSDMSKRLKENASSMIKEMFKMLREFASAKDDKNLIQQGMPQEQMGLDLGGSGRIR